LTTNATSTTFVTPNTPPTNANSTYPTNGITVTYNGSNQFEWTRDATAATDADNDPLSLEAEILRKSDMSLVKNINVANNSQVFVNKSELQAHTEYIFRWRTSDGIENTPYTTHSFNTPNTPPPSINIVSPSGGHLINYVNGEIEIKTTPTNAKDADDDDLTKNVKVFGPGLDTLITQPNPARIFLKESRLQPNSTYTIEVTGSDGIETSPMLSTWFLTPVIVGLQEDTARNWRAHPNPFGEHLYILGKRPAEVRICDVRGSEVYRQVLELPAVISPDLDPGIYILLMSDERQSVRLRLLKR
jgi:hypothetical protein